MLNVTGTPLAPARAAAREDAVQNALHELASDQSATLGAVLEHVFDLGMTTGHMELREIVGRALADVERSATAKHAAADRDPRWGQVAKGMEVALQQVIRSTGIAPGRTQTYTLPADGAVAFPISDDDEALFGGCTTDTCPCKQLPAKAES